MRGSGADTDAGIGQYAILVSEDAGPFEEWQTFDRTSASFPGKWGRSYAFTSVAVDRAGNRQEAPGAPSALVAIDDCGPFDFAVTKVKAPKSLKLTAKKPARRVLVKVQIQNRSAQAQTIADAATLAELVELAVDSLGVDCVAAAASLRDGKPQKSLPLRLASKKKVVVVFDVVFDCANDPAKGAVKDPFPNGKLAEKGCAEARVDVTVR